jgi:UDP-GlcNAc3NAcA epimerase
MRLATVVGARPQFVKAAAISRALAECGRVEEILIHTGQHYDANMSDVFFQELRIPPPKHHLGIGGGGHGQQTGRMLEAIERVLLEEKPDWLLIYGDTNSTLAGAVAAAKLHIPVAHVEAGLRSYNRRMPEEINRIAADHLSDLLLPPTQTAVDNLTREGIVGSKVRMVGDVMLDVALDSRAAAAALPGGPSRWGLSSKGFVLATIHRAENTDDPIRLAAVVGGLIEIAKDLPVVLPLHPRTRGALARSSVLPDPLPAGLRLIDPVGYLEMVLLEMHAQVIVTDSGGVQKEAFFHHVPCVTMRDETEWVELVEAGWNRLAPPTSAAAVAAAVRAAIENPPDGKSAPALYGDGTASFKIAEIFEARSMSRSMAA